VQYFKNHTPAHGDVAVLNKGGLFLEKRVVALPGDTIEGRDNTIYLNGKAVSEPYVQHIGIPTNDFPFLQNFGPITVRTGECFVLGDNRDNSLDSRDPEFGPIPFTAMIGRPLYIVTSKERDRAWERIQ
jgi:signal peptidase I